MHDCYIDLDQQFTFCVEVRSFIYFFTHFTDGILAAETAIGAAARK